LRILHVVPTYWPAVRYGGPIRSVHALARSLARLGHEVHVFTTNVDGASDSEVPLDRPVDLDGVKVSYFPSKTLRRLYWSSLMARAIAKHVPSFDIVHLHSVFLLPTWMAARAARRADVPYVLAPRGMLVPELIKRRSRWIKTVWISLIERRNVMAAAAIHATSDVEAEDLRRFGWRLPRVAMIPNGVDDPPTCTGETLSADVVATIGDGGFVFSLGRLVWKKGLDRLIACLPEVPGARLVLAGDDPEGHAAQLQRQAARCGVADRLVVLPRHIEGNDKEALFAASRVFAMPSLSENFGLAAIEAMRRAIPVIVTPEVGMASIVQFSGGGLVVDGNHSAIASGLNRLLDDPAAAREMGIAGQSHVIARYGWETVAKAVEELYGLILSSPSGRAAR
jgi:glycosyltransferase involved in cell wall biosynthesis